MTKETVKILSITVVLIAGIGIGGYAIWRRLRNEEIELNAEGFAGVLKKARNIHPDIFEWWNNLPPSQQSTIEKSLDIEALKTLNRDFNKKNLSPETIYMLKVAGYNFN